MNAATRLAKQIRFQMLVTSEDMRKIRALAKLEGEGMATVVRMIVRREYDVRIRSPRRSK